MFFSSDTWSWWVGSCLGSSRQDQIRPEHSWEGRNLVNRRSDYRGKQLQKLPFGWWEKRPWQRHNIAICNINKLQINWEIVNTSQMYQIQQAVKCQKYKFGAKTHWASSDWFSIYFLILLCKTNQLHFSMVISLVYKRVEKCGCFFGQLF